MGTLLQVTTLLQTGTKTSGISDHMKGEGREGSREGGPLGPGDQRPVATEADYWNCVWDQVGNWSQ